jgi:hypothetical protein
MAWVMTVVSFHGVRVPEILHVYIEQSLKEWVRKVVEPWCLICVLKQTVLILEV